MAKYFRWQGKNISSHTLETSVIVEKIFVLEYG